MANGFPQNEEADDVGRTSPADSARTVASIAEPAAAEGADSRRPHVEIRQTLNDLRARIRKYVLIEGTCIVIVALCAAFWITFSFDALHFQIRKLELPGWFRTACTLIAVGIVVAAAGLWLGARLLRGFRSQALALVLEKRFPQLGDRLITAVELAADPRRAPAGLGGAMLQRTVAEAAAQARGLDLATVFNSEPLRRWVIAAAVLLVSVFGFGALRVEAMQRWFHAFVLLDEDYWEPYRKSAMTVHVVVQPGDRRKEFTADGTYKHPRGADLTLLAEVPAGREVPPDVSLEFRADGMGRTSRGAVVMSPAGDRSFTHTLGRVIDEHQLWVVGGDFVSRQPYRVVIVEPPGIDEIVLRCDYPDYTGLDSLADHDRRAQGTQMSLPMETQFVLQARANKPLVAVQIRCEHFDLEFSAPGIDPPRPATLSVHPLSPEGAAEAPAESRLIALPEAVSRDWFGKDGKSFSVPMVLATRAGAQLRSLGNDFRALPLPLPLPPDTQLQIYLEDRDDVASSEPTLLTINGVTDAPPVVETRRNGVGASITRLAEIPVEGRITDDYGVVTARFGYRIEEAGEFQPRPLDVLPRGERDFTLGPAEGNRTERFRVTPLELRVDQKLALTVFAEDGDNLNGPHVSHGEVYTFTVVTPEELLAQLYDRELNLRLRFEQIRSEVQRVREDLNLHQRRAREGRTLRDQPPADEARPAWEEQLRQIDVAVAASAERSLHSIRKTHTESRSVEVGFRELREEMVNNRVDTATALQRIDYGVLQPLHAINESEYPRTDERIGLFRLAHENRVDPDVPLVEAVAAVDRLLVRMDQVLAQMKDREDYNELVKLAQKLLEKQMELRKATQTEQERRFFDLLQ